MCGNCRWLGAGSLCTQPKFVAWNHGDPKLPAPAAEYCCNYYEPARAGRKDGPAPVSVHGSQT